MIKVTTKPVPTLKVYLDQDTEMPVLDMVGNVYSGDQWFYSVTDRQGNVVQGLFREMANEDVVLLDVDIDDLVSVSREDIAHLSVYEITSYR